MDQVFLDNTLREWIVAAGILVIAVLGMWAVERFVLARLSRLARRTQTDIDDLVITVLRKTKLGLLVVVALFFASLSLTLDPSVRLVLRRAAAIAVVLQGGVWSTAAIRFFTDRFVDAAPGDRAAVTTVSAIGFLGRLAVWVLVLLLILDNVGVEVTALITGLGIGGIAVALAVQSVLGDLLASLSIVLDKPFVIGDFLIVGDFKGSVEHVGLKTTRLRALGGEQLVVGNRDLLESRIRNLGRMSDRRVVFTIGITYETERAALARVPGWIREIVEEQPDTRFDRSHLASFGAYSIDFETVYYVTVPEYLTYMDIQQAINLALMEKFAAEGVEFAYPTQVIYAIEGEEPGDGMASGRASVGESGTGR